MSWSRGSLIALMMDATSTCETLVNFYRGNLPEDSRLFSKQTLLQLQSLPVIM
jgi:hypothetical protein